MVTTLLLNLIITATVSFGHGGSHGHGDKPEGERDPHREHEIFLGSHEMAEEFDELPPAEAKSRLLQLANKMDMDDDGLISKGELSNWMTHSMNKLQDKEAEKDFADHDTNRDGFVGWEEYKSVEFESQGETSERDGDSDINEMFEEDKVFYDAADFDKNGKLSIKEYYSFSFPESDPKRMNKATTKVFQLAHDSNKDGVIDIEEFMDNRSKDYDGLWFEVEKDEFVKLDLNNDGKLDNKEIQNLNVPTMADEIERLVNHLLSKSDDDKDDELSMQEIADHHDVFVGSEVTDFGNDLHMFERYDDEL